MDVASSGLTLSRFTPGQNGDLGEFISFSRPMPTALFYGYQVFTTFVWPIEPVWLEAHLSRLITNAETLGIPENLNPEGIYQALEKSLGPQQPRSSNQMASRQIVRLSLFPEVNAFQELFSTHDRSNLIMTCRPAAFLSKKDSPVTVKTVRYQKALPHVKHGGLAEPFALKRQAISDGFDDALWVNHAGYITETTHANVFFIKNGQLLTADVEKDGCLPGITRKKILKKADQLQISVKNKAVRPVQLVDMEAAFITNAVIGCQPVSRIDEHSLQPSPESTALLNTLQRELEGS